ncbi:hypothetical protein QWY82_14325 [Simiduia curdlanivorans]|uniref:Glycosyltransferase n=1 Tax=Simiduia curdlanivorans TaxID=1492769 RepID=A0ABV8V1L1_9GAMM|nr:hypothetical protein [Simiduia curdlanivorans]MDN3639975.1 hypothetical protein [Simiduia curdlanivorans]
MLSAKHDLILINRSFWPIYPVIGEALLRFAEKQSSKMKIGVILQDHVDIRSQLAKQSRGGGISFYPCKAFSVSGSGIIRRILDALYFMLHVFLVLLFKRPKKVYVSTDPPVLVPLIVMLYCKIFKADYVYHLQDIHPEAANVVVRINYILYSVLRWLDSVVMRNAGLIITITDEMVQEITSRSSTKSPVIVLQNPAVAFDSVTLPDAKKNGFTFCGNAGRLQRIPLLAEAISHYYDLGGQLPFVFAGGGVYASDLRVIASKYPNFTYKGQISANEAAQLNSEYKWALLPIEDEVTRFAFPSKSSSYVYSGACIVAICGKQTSVASWVLDKQLGVVIRPETEVICEFFFDVENQRLDTSHLDFDRQELKKQLSFDVFVDRLIELVSRESLIHD